MKKIKLSLAALLLPICFLFAQPLEPLLMFPPDMAPDIPMEGASLMWMQPDFQPTYLFEIYLDLEEFFPNPPVYMGPALEFFMGDHFEFPAPPLLPGMLYCWKIRVTDTLTMMSMESMTWHFFTAFSLPPAPPMLIMPPNGHTEADPDGVILECAPAGGGAPDGYRFYFGEAPPVLPLVQDSPETFYQTGPLLPGTWYYWYVEAYNNYGTSISDLWSFQTSGDLVPPPPELVSPADEDDDVPCDELDACWNHDAPAGLVSYWSFHMDTDPAFPNPPLYTGPIDPDDRNRSQYHYTVGPLIPEQVYYWFVRAYYYLGGELQHVDSEVFSFTTGTSVIPSSTISGTVMPASSLFNAGGVTVTCPGACVPATVTTPINGNYSFTVNNSGSYVVTPAKAGFYFTPAGATFSNVQSPQTQNFWMYSLVPNPAMHPIPHDGATDVPYNIGYIQWSYEQDPGFSPPTEFAVYMPADSPDPIAVVPYSRPMDMFLDIGDIEGESADARVVPRNGHGEWIEVLSWSWSVSQPASGQTHRPRCIYPQPMQEWVSPDRMVMTYGPYLARTEFPPDSFFDVFCDPDPLFPGPPIYSGTGLIDPMDASNRYLYAPPLLPATQYHWKIVIHYSGLTEESLVSSFTTATEPIMYPEPLLLAPADGLPGLPPEGVDLQFDQEPWQVDSFFDVYCDIDPGFPSLPVYSGPLDPGRTLFEFHKAALLAEQTYYWYVRYTNFVDHWFATSPVWTFITSPHVVPSSVITGTITSTHNVSSVNVTCPGAVVPATVSTGYSGTFSFTVNNGGTYTVTPTKPGYSFSPPSYVFSNVQSNQTANFTMKSLLPNLATTPLPSMNAMNVSIYTDRLEWDYVQNPYYSEPNGFSLYFGGVELAWVDYSAGQEHYAYELESPYPIDVGLENQSYGWILVATDDYGDAEGAQEWRFTTGYLEPPPEPELIFPEDGAMGLPYLDCQLKFDLYGDWRADSFFDVYLDIDPGFPSPAVYHGTGEDLFDDGIFTLNQAVLLDEQAYYWCVRITNLTNGLSNISPVWSFSTGGTPQPAVVVSPGDAAEGVLLDATLNWQSGGGDVDYYLLSFGTDNPPTNILHNHNNGMNTSYDPDVMYCQVTYYWQVVPHSDEYGNASGCPVWSFTTMNGSTSLVHPVNGAFGLPTESLTLTWELPNGQYYADSFFDVFCDIDLDFPNPPLYSGPILPTRDSFEYMIEHLMPEQLYYWHVRYNYNYNGTMFQIDSDVYSFTTGTSVIPSSTISGSILPGNPLFNVSGVSVSCPGACVPATVTTQAGGSYSFTVNNGGSYVVTPAKSGWCFNPASATFSNVQGDQTANFTMNSMYPNGATQPVPAHQATNVSIQVGQLQWTYVPEPGYSLPTQFEVYFPAGSPDPVIVDYPSRDSLFTLSIPELEYMSPYDWKVIPRNDYGWYVDWILWEFTTEDSLRPPSLISPYMFADDFESGTTDAWSMGPIGGRSQPPYLFEVYMDTDPAFPSPPNYAGDGHPDEATPGYFWSRSNGLAYNEHYYWKVVAYLNEQVAESEVWEFDTLDEPTPPVLVFPPDLAPGIPVQDVNLEWDLVNWDIDSFFDVFCDIDPSFPNPPAFSGTITPSRYHFMHTLPALMQEQTYYWYVRYTNLAGGWSVSSLIRQFTTGNFAIPYSTITGTISSSHNVSNCTVTCPQACVPAIVTTGIGGTFSFNVNNGLNPVVTPSKQGYWFNPGFHQFNNIQSNQTANFLMNSLLPNTAIQPVPIDLETGVSVDWSTLQWTYVPGEFYSAPDAFHGSFFVLPGREMLHEEEIPYTGPGDYIMTLPPSLLPMDYGTTYHWEIAPYNADGVAEGVETWSFATEEEPLPPPEPLYVYPGNHDTGVDDAGLVMAWDPPPGWDYPVESFFDVYCDIDPGFPGPPVYSRQIPPPDPLNPCRRYAYMPDLDLGTLHYWKVVVTDPSTGQSTEGPTWDFTTAVAHVEHPAPLLVLPLDGETGIPPEGTDLTWSYDPWMVDSFFDVFCDIDPGFPNPPVYSGPGSPSRTILEYHLAGLLAEQPYHWFVRYSNFVDHWYAKSPVQTFTTGETNPLTLVYPPDGEMGLPAEELTLQFDHALWQVDSFFDVYVDLDPDFPNPPCYSGPLDPGARALLHYDIGPLMANQLYYWKVRVTQAADQWTSAIRQLTTGNYVLPSSTVSGTVLKPTPPGGFLSGVTITCAVNGIIIAKAYSSGIDGSYCFNLANSSSATYYVTPVLSAAVYYFSPSFYSYANLSSDQTGQDFYRQSYTPNWAVNPLPTMNALNVSVNLPQLQWTYIQAAGYGEPTGFEVFFPADNPVPILVPYPARDSIFTADITFMSPLDYRQVYDWKVVPFNDYGPSEYLEEWNFITEPEPSPFFPPELFIYPSDNSADKGPELIMAWGDPPGGGRRDNFREDITLSVYIETDPVRILDISTPPVYIGPLQENPLCYWQYYFEPTTLEYSTNYSWSVSYTIQDREVCHSPIWTFSTGSGPITHPAPVLVLPLEGEAGVGPRGVDFHWDYDWTVDSFFDVYCDIDPAFPDPPIYSGQGDPVRTILEYHKAALLAEQPYYWFVRYSNFVDYWYSQSPVQIFTTGTHTPPPPPELIAPPDLATGLPPGSVDLEWTCDPDWWVESFFDVYCDIDPGFPQAPVYSGSGQELLNEGLFSFNQAYLLDEQGYYWYVRITDLISGFSTDSPVWHFTTGVVEPLVLLYPPDGETGLPAEEFTLQFDHALWQPDSFFDIFLDMDPDFPEEPIYSGPLVPVAGTLFHYEIGPLMAEQWFHWKVRVTQGLNEWTSAVRSFGTGTYVVPTHSVSGTLYNQSGIATGNRKITYYANNVYMGYVNSSPNPPYGSYTIHLPDHATTVYKVVPVKPTAIQYWSPSFTSYTNLTSNQTGQDYYLNSFTPNQATQPVPIDFADNISVNVGQLQWSYVQQPNYGEPVGFEVYFPSGSPEPYAVVPYARDPVYVVDVPPLEPNTDYLWTVIPYNDYGWAEYYEEWHFTTEEAFLPPAPLYVYPGTHDTDVDDAGLVMVWESSDEPYEPAWQYQYELYCDSDPLFPNPPLLSGSPHPAPPDPLNPGSHYCSYMPDLDLGTHYYWKIVVTDLATELSTEGPVWDFTTTPTHVEHPAPLLVLPLDGETGIPPEGTDLTWSYDPWMVDSFFDVFCDIDPGFPNPPVYSGPGSPSRTILEYHLAGLLAEQPYHWFVRYSNFVDHWYAKSPVQTFTTGETNPLTLVYPPDGEMGLPAEELTLQFDHALWQVDSFFDVYVDLDPDFPNPPCYSGPLDPGARALLHYDIGPLMANQLYYWKVRVTQAADQWTSAIRQLTTGNYVLPSSTVSGTVLKPTPPGGFLSGVTITCAVNGIIIAKAYSSGIDGSYCFNLANSSSATYYVTPVLSAAVYYFSPSFYSYANLSSDQTGQDFYRQSYTPNWAVNPLPAMNAIDVSVNLPQLQWTYIQAVGYGEPTGFEVYFPADNPVPIVVPYQDRNPVFSADITFMSPLDPNTDYGWTVIPFNDHGWAEYYEQWHFTTEDAPLPPTPLYIYPGNHEPDVPENGLIMAWDPPSGREDFPVDSFFDVYCDIDPGFPNPPIYSGGDPAPPDPLNPGRRYLYAPELALGTQYYWKVVVTDPATGLSSEGPVWDFFTLFEIFDPPEPWQVLPAEGQPEVFPFDLDFVWWMDDLGGNNWFDLYYDITPDFSSPEFHQVTGYWNILRTYFEWHCSDLLAEQTYYWYVRYSNFGDFWYSQSPVGTFTTGSGALPSPVLTIEASGLLTWTLVPGAGYYNIYKSDDPYGPFVYVGYTTDLAWLDPDHPQGKAFYRVTAATGSPTGSPVLLPPDQR
jgi:hypothetical protein